MAKRREDGLLVVTACSASCVPGMGMGRPNPLAVPVAKRMSSHEARPRAIPTPARSMAGVAREAMRGPAPVPCPPPCHSPSASPRCGTPRSDFRVQTPRSPGRSAGGFPTPGAQHRAPAVFATPAPPGQHPRAQVVQGLQEGRFQPVRDVSQGYQRPEQASRSWMPPATPRSGPGAARSNKSWIPPPVAGAGFNQMASSQMASSQMASSQMASSQMASSQMASSQMVNSQMASSQMVNSQMVNSQMVNSQMVNSQMSKHMTNQMNSQNQSQRMASAHYDARAMAMNRSASRDAGFRVDRSEQRVGRMATNPWSVRPLPPVPSPPEPDASLGFLTNPMPNCTSMVIDARPPELSMLQGCQTMIATASQQEMLAVQQLAPRFPHCASLVAYPALYKAARKSQVEVLQMSSAYASRQHPAKINTGIPNADAVLEGLDYLGIADGVSGVYHLGLSPDALPWELLRSCGKGLFAAAAKGEPRTGRSLGNWLVNLIEESYDATEEQGATTLLLAAIKGTDLVTACLGDSAILVLRPVSFVPLRLKTIFKTEPGRFDERRPVQVQRLEGCDVELAHDVIRTAAVATTPVQPGDFLVLGTDGLFDNLSDLDIKQVLERCCRASGSNDELHEAAAALVDLAIKSVRLGPDNMDRPPWQNNTSAVPANNADDTTALVAMIQAEDLSLSDVFAEIPGDRCRRGHRGSSDRMASDGRRGSQKRSFSTGTTRGRSENCVIS
ncbi:unnamed protein product [Effrenium voratum]|uniref:Protein phosphatase n=1 Tax=Effrenium voratum TaxID=2562239 RepID=A0AA36MU82_9DINO|nr:unnamed protein product [Effrenium voratum]